VSVHTWMHSRKRAILGKWASFLACGRWRLWVAGLHSPRRKPPALVAKQARARAQALQAQRRAQAAPAALQRAARAQAARAQAARAQAARARTPALQARARAAPAALQRAARARTPALQARARAAPAARAMVHASSDGSARAATRARARRLFLVRSRARKSSIATSRATAPDLASNASIRSRRAMPLWLLLARSTLAAAPDADASRLHEEPPGLRARWLERAQMEWPLLALPWAAAFSPARAALVRAVA